MDSVDVTASMIWIFFWVGLWFGACAWVGSFAKGRGHGFSGYFWLSVCLSPLIGLIGVLIAGTTEEAKRTAAGDTRKCPHCAEMVKPEAKVCRYCQRDLP
jgi:zinc-ribbon domain